MARRELAGRRAIVTGASGGIGRELARQLARETARLVLIARRADRLNDLAAEFRGLDRDVEIVAGDVTDPAVRHEAVSRANTSFGGLDILINNAGIGAVGHFKDAEPDRLRRIMEVNFFAAAEMIRVAVPALQHGTTPIVVNVGSILGHRGIPLHSEYCASKFALRGLSDSLRTELGAVGIDLLLVSPGTTDTEFFENVIERAGEFSWKRGPGTPPAKVAAKILRAMRRGKREIVPSVPCIALMWLNRFAPGVVDWWVRSWA